MKTAGREEGTHWPMNRKAHVPKLAAEVARAAAAAAGQPCTVQTPPHSLRPRVACQICIRFLGHFSGVFSSSTPQTMAPIDSTHRVAAQILARSAVAVLAQRNLTVRGAQGVTLGVIAAYVVGIAILWNIPYLRYVLWPFKVCYRFRNY